MNTASSFLRSCRRQLPQSLPTRTALQLQQPLNHFSSSRAVFSQPDAAVEPTTSQPPAGVLSSNSPPTLTTPLQSSESVSTSASSETTLPSATEAESLKSSFKFVGTVTRTGTMKQTVVVTSNRQYFDNFLKKHYTTPFKTLVHDPQDTLAEGDVIVYESFPPDQLAERSKRGKKNVKYTLRDVITPFGLPIDQRTPRVITPNPAKQAVKNPYLAKQRKVSGVRGFATISQPSPTLPRISLPTFPTPTQPGERSGPSAKQARVLLTSHAGQGC